MVKNVEISLNLLHLLVWNVVLAIHLISIPGYTHLNVRVCVSV